MGKVSYTYIFFYFLTGFGPLLYPLVGGMDTPILEESKISNPVDFDCPFEVNPLFTQEEVCSGDHINPPNQPTILSNVFPNESAFVIWDMDINAPVFNTDPNCNTIEIVYNYFIHCFEDPDFILPGGSHTVTVHPELQPPQILIDADCNYTIVPHCPTDQVNPPFVDPFLPEQNFMVNNPLGCSQNFLVPTPPCEVSVSDINITQICNEYIVDFMISGGTGTYLVNAEFLPPGQNHFISAPIPCGTSYNFQVTDDIFTNEVIVSGPGPACLPPFFTSAPNVIIVGTEFIVEFFINGGSGNYTVDGQPTEPFFSSLPIPCGQPFSFLVSDGCENLIVSGDPVQCFEPITVEEPIINQVCNQYQVTIVISGGTGNYIVNGTPLPPGQNTATSQFVPCGTSFFIQVTDDQGTDIVDINGVGPACLPTLFNSPPVIEVIGLQYQVTFTIQGGTGNYTVNGQPLIGNTFVSDLIPCGFPYSFEVFDGCQTIFVSEPLVQCYPPINAEVSISRDCNEFQVTLFLGGGTGNYIVNGIPLAPGQVEFISAVMACEEAYIFQITDDLGSDQIQIADIGPACVETLTISDESVVIIGSEFKVSFTISNGTGNYFVDGQPVAGNTFTSELIDCGQPYSFEVSDDCTSTTVSGGPVTCFPSIETSEVLIGQSCEAYTAQFSISGGTENYLVDNIPLDGNIFTSDPLPCGTPFNFDVTDDLMTDQVTVSGDGPNCPDSLTPSDPVVGISGNQYTARFEVSGGTQNYSVDDIPLDNTIFTSPPIDCGEPYSFTLSDGCTTITIEGGPFNCFPPIETSEVLIGQSCEAYTAQFTVSGGNNEYLVDNIPLEGNLFTSPPIPCGTPYTFNVTDAVMSDQVQVTGNGPACPPPLEASNPTIGYVGAQYTAQFEASNGTQNYNVDGVPLPGNVFISDPIDCGQPYEFVLSDGCSEIVISGGPIECFSPITIGPVDIFQDCDEYSVGLTITGGTGMYRDLLDTVIVPSVFMSDPMPCGTPYEFVFTDHLNTDTAFLSGLGPPCLDPLEAIDLEINVQGLQYTVQFEASGGTQNYSIDDVPLDGPLFFSNPLDCGQPYTFTLGDGCSEVIISGGPIECYPPITIGPVDIFQDCDEYSVGLTITGGTGMYRDLLDTVIVPSVFMSDPMPCGTPYEFVFTDHLNTDTAFLSGLGPPCLDPLEAIDLEINVQGLQYTVQFEASGGTQIYGVDGVPLDGPLFFSNPLDCGQPYSFTLTDGCSAITIDGGPVLCFPPITTSEVIIGQSCEAYTAQFSVSGGTEEYLVNGIPIDGNIFTSDPMPCGTPYNFDVTDALMSDQVTVAGNGPDCADSLTASDPQIGILGNQFTVQFEASGGTQNYSVDGIPLDDIIFTSPPIDCGQSYSFTLFDGCTAVTIEGGPELCFPPIETSEVLIGQSCDAFTAQFSISGGTGNYLINNIPLDGEIFTSDPLPCGSPYNFDVTDDLMSDQVTVAGNGPDCADSLTASDPQIGILGNQFTVQFEASGGTQNYSVDGIPLDDTIFTSPPIDCGQPYSFTLSDGCTTVTIEGGPELCFPPIETSEVLIGRSCDAYTAQFSISGGTGNYLINNIPLDGEIFTSDPIPCGSPYNFDVTDDLMSDQVTVAGNGPDCADSLTASDVQFGILGSQYTAQFEVNGGTQNYSVDGIPLDGTLFTSGPIDCGEPFSFDLTDGCDLLVVSGEAPCSPCPTTVGDFSDSINQCVGDLPNLPSDTDILASIDFPDQAIIEWAPDPNLPLTHTGESCSFSTISYALQIVCASDTTVKLFGGVIDISVYPAPTAPTVSIIDVDTTGQMCTYRIEANCDFDDIIGDIEFNRPNQTTGDSINISVANPGCPEMEFTVAIPDCIIVDLNDPIHKPFYLSVHHNPFGLGSELGLQFTLPETTEVSLIVYDLNGRIVKVLKRHLYLEGTHYVSWNGRATNGHEVPSGMYLVEMKTPQFRKVVKAIKVE